MKWILYKYAEMAMAYNHFLTECLFVVLGLCV